MFIYESTSLWVYTGVGQIAHTTRFFSNQHFQSGISFSAATNKLINGMANQPRMLPKPNMMINLACTDPTLFSTSSGWIEQQIDVCGFWSVQFLFCGIPRRLAEDVAVAVLQCRQAPSHIRLLSYGPLATCMCLLHHQNFTCLAEQNDFNYYKFANRIVTQREKFTCSFRLIT